jgi:ABC-type multidrug transport system fused ATPase/permease subunit
VALVAMLWRATEGVVDGRMTLGDLVMVNAFMIQLYIPLNFLGVLYREIKQSLTDLDKMFTLLEREREVADAPGASRAAGQGDGAGALRARRFRLRPGAAHPARRELRDPGRQDGGGGGAVGRASPRWRGCCTASMTCSRRRITDRRAGHPRVTQASLRRPSASCRRTRCCSTTRSNTTSPTAAPAPPRGGGAAAQRGAHPRLHQPTPKGYDTMVGERGLKLSAARSSVWPLPARC